MAPTDRQDDREVRLPPMFTSKIAPVSGCLMTILLLVCGADRASAQQCPRNRSTQAQAPSRVQSLEGRLVYHQGIRQWLELRLSEPKCGQTSLEITAEERALQTIQGLRGCRVRSSGAIDYSPTGYYSKDLYQQVRQMEPVGGCARKRPFPDYSVVKPDRHVRSYAVTMDVDYRPGDHPIVFHARSAGRELRPWQAYASYMLTGGFVLYGSCGGGFMVDRVHGTPEARPSHFDTPRTPEDKAMFDPERAAAAGKVRLHLGYSCVRTPPGKG
jgi:hypothetical protein